MLAIKRNRIAVMPARGVVPLAETERVVSERDIAALDQMQGRVQLWIPRQPRRFALARLRRLVRADHNRRASREIFRNEQVSGRELAGLSLIDQLAQRVTAARHLLDHFRIKRRFCVRRLAEEMW